MEELDDEGLELIYRTPGSVDDSPTMHVVGRNRPEAMHIPPLSTIVGEICAAFSLNLA
jgi:hypothetical protein